MKTIKFNECLEILKCKRTRLLNLIHQGKVPAAKVGRSWVFIESDIYQYLRDEMTRTQELKQQRRQITELLTRKILKEVPHAIRKRGRRRTYHPDVEFFLSRKK